MCGKADGSQVLDPQRDALLEAEMVSGHLCKDLTLGRLGRDLVNTMHGLTARGIGFKVLTGQGAQVDTTTAQSKLVFGIFAALAEFERELTSDTVSD